MNLTATGPAANHAPTTPSAPAASLAPSLVAELNANKRFGTHERAKLEQAISSSNRMVGDAVTALGGTPRPITQLGQLTSAQVRSFGTKPDRHTLIPLGTQVWSSPTDSWFVTGNTPDGKLRVARRDASTGKLVAGTGSISTFARFTGDLLDTTYRDAQGQQWIVTGDNEAVTAFGRHASVGLIPKQLIDALDELRNDETIAPKEKKQRLQELTGAIYEARVRTTWGDVMSATQLEKRVARATPASEDGELELRLLVGDKTIVQSKVAAGAAGKDRALVIGNDRDPASAADAVKGAHQVSQWFKDKTGITFWPGREPLIINTDNPDYVANAAASVGFDGNARQFGLYEGPRDSGIHQSFLHDVDPGASGRADQYVRKVSRMIKRDDTMVRYHEAGHIANGMTWVAESEANADQLAPQDPNAPNPYALETGMVNEAMADLFGMARSEKPTSSIRNFSSLNSKWGTLEKLRGLLPLQFDPENPTKYSYDVHDGTQLITKPMVAFGKTQGWDALAEVAGGANHLLAARIRRGDFDVVRVPESAQALYDSIAARYGADSKPAKDALAAWVQLGALTADGAAVKDATATPARRSSGSASS